VHYQASGMMFGVWQHKFKREGNYHGEETYYYKY
jgi:hypothetical protein